MKLPQLSLRDLIWLLLVVVVARPLCTARAADIARVQDQILKAHQSSANELDIAVRVLLRANHLGEEDDSWWSKRLAAPQQKGVASILKLVESKMTESDNADDRGPIDFVGVDSQLAIIHDPVGQYQSRTWGSTVLRTDMGGDWFRTGRPERRAGEPKREVINNVDPIPCIRSQFEFREAPLAIEKVDAVGMDKAVREFVETNPLTAQIVVVWRGKDPKSKKKYFAVVGLTATAEGWKESAR